MFGSCRAGFFGIAVGTFLIGYCVYFDYKRRKDPEYKRKVHERRNKTKSEAKEESVLKYRDVTALERFFMQELYLSETLLAAGNYESGVEHLANAIVVSSQPIQILRLFQATLPPQIFEMLRWKIQSQSSVYVGAATQSMDSIEENIAE